jgi:Uma2 family endonuclease
MKPPIRTLADLLDRLGGVPLDRIRFQPPPGTATLNDLLALDVHENGLCELVEGVLVEKTVGLTESLLAVFLGELLGAFVRRANLGLVTGPDGTLEVMPHLVRIPDVAFTNWDRIPGRRRPTAAVPRLVPNLAVEILSESNTPGEMTVKRREYFTAGVELVWEIDPRTRTVTVYTSAAASRTLTPPDVLDGGTVLPGFRLPLQDYFGELDRQG